MQPVILLHASLQSGPRYEWETALLESLPYAMQTRLSRQQDDARRASLAGIALALFGASELCAAPLSPRSLRFPVDGRPWLEGGPAFSVSHTDGRVACLVAAAGAPGLDVEWLGHEEDPERTPRLRRWTAVEAVLKAAGAGLTRASDVQLEADLRTCGLDGNRYGLLELRLADRWVAHVAERGVSGAPVLREVDLGSADLSAALERSIGLHAQFEQLRPEA